MFHCLAWAAPQLQYSPTACGTCQIEVILTQVREEMGHPVINNVLCSLCSFLCFSGCEGQVEHSVFEECANCNQCIQENGFCSDCKVGQQDLVWKFSSSYFAPLSLESAVQSGWSGCCTGNGDKLSNSQVYCLA